MKKAFRMREELDSAGKIAELDENEISVTSEELVGSIRPLIEQAKARLAQSVNSELVLLYWHIGRRINERLPAENRAEYGAKVVELVCEKLTAEYGKGFRRSNVFHMIRFAEVFDDLKIVQTLSGLLSWSHFIEIIYLKDPLQRQFYAEMARVERWSVRTLRKKIQGMLYERTAISRKPEELARQELEALQEEDRMTPDLVFRDPYLLDFLGMEDTYSERDLEAVILRELERFLLELGTDFSFIARQKRMTIGDRDFYLDLLFYHRSLHRLVAIELKLGSFDAAYKGQMELYLRWLDRYERRLGEEPPIGLILCGEKNREQIELLQLDRGEIRVAEYLVELPPRRLLEAKLHEAIRLARGQVEAREETQWGGER
jgi:predicted nuclease of restriction endonuclease-like (RecB) superfamily